MRVVKLTGVQVESLKAFQVVREEKNKSIRDEKSNRKACELSIAELNQKCDEVTFVFNGKPIALWTTGTRQDIDRDKLQRLYPEAFKACYLPMPTWTLDVLI